MISPRERFALAARRQRIHQAQREELKAPPKPKIEIVPEPPVARACEIRKEIAEAKAAKVARKGKPKPDLSIVEGMLTQVQAAKQYGVTMAALHCAGKSGRLESIKVGRNRYYKPADLKAYFAWSKNAKREAMARARNAKLKRLAEAAT